MKAEELRIGNWIEAVASMGNYPMKMTEYNFVSLINNPNCANPIVLTPEILEKCGFVSNPYQNRFELGQVHIQYCGVRNMFWIENYSAELKSLHQLQNLTYALTGEEITFEP